MIRGMSSGARPCRSRTRWAILDGVVQDGQESRPPANLRAAVPGAVDSSRPEPGESATAPAPAPIGRGDGPIARVLRPSGRAARRTASEFAAFARRPSGRIALPGLLLGSLVAITGTAGAYLVSGPGGDGAAERTGVVATTRPAGIDGQAVAPETGEPLAPTLDPSATSSPADATTGDATRPADALADWARQISDKIDVPPVAMQAYGYAEVVLAQTRPSCRLSWTTLAAIGKVESNHGRAGNATLLADGRAMPSIIGPALDGTGGRRAIHDTDVGALDGDRTWDHAVGPMQFIPSTWRQHAVDADDDGVRDPNDIDDAALSAAYYLCGVDRDLTKPADWWAAVLAYNDVRPYADQVFAAANEYGLASRT
jgi:hypothetical protein